MPRADPVDVVVDLLRGRAPAPDPRGALVAIDGPAGSGKTTLAAGLAARVEGAVVVHTDDLLAGWDGLPGLPDTLAALLEPLARGRAGRYRRYDWHADAYAEQVEVAASPLVVVEGVGAGARPATGIDVLVWVEAPYDVRMRRGIERDGEAFAPYWQRWGEAESALFAAHRTRERAHVRIDGTGEVAPWVSRAGPAAP